MRGNVSVDPPGQRNPQDGERSDGELVRQALSGEQHAFEALVSRYRKALFGLIYHYVGEYQEACDVLQQVWLQLSLSLATLRPKQHIKPWLFVVARNRSLDALRRKRVPSFSEVEADQQEGEATAWEAIADTSPLPEELVERRELQQAIQRAIQALPPRSRAVVGLYYAEHLTFAEIGRALNMPASTVKTRFYRAKPLLRAGLTAK